MKKSILFTVLSSLVILSLACNFVTQLSEPAATVPSGEPAQIEAGTETETAPASEPATAAPDVPTPPPPPPDVFAPLFAHYNQSAARLPESFQGGYSLPLDLNAVNGLDIVTLSEEQKALLAQNGFVAATPVPGKYREFYQVYESQRYAFDQPLFITTDAVFHVYHLFFDKILRDLEKEQFIPRLEKLTLALLERETADFQSIKGTALEGPALRNVAFFAVAARLLEVEAVIPPEAQSLVDAELALIEAHAGPEISPVWDRDDLPDDKKLIEDYSQYIPRGHYTRSDALKRYFKAMMWYGRMTLRLRDGFETQRALLMTQAVRSVDDGVDDWRAIYDPTVFIVGKSDDLSFFEYGALSDQIFGKRPALTDFADPMRLAQFQEAGRLLPPPQVNSMWVWITEDKTEATQGFRFMGQRFTLDQYVFGQVIWRNVGTTDLPRGMPKSMDFMAALGSDEARQILSAEGEDQYAHYNDQMTKVRNEIAGLGEDSWTQNLYWSWLYAFRPVIAPKDGRYPAFMQTQAWTRKSLHTALGSWTELKHDTILYAKQVMAEMGGGEPGEPPHGYVEPDPEAFARLLALAQMTNDGLDQRGLLSDLTRGNLANLIDLLGFLKSCAEKELAGETLSNEEYWRIQYFGGELESLTLASSDCDEQETAGCSDLSDQKAALIADVATGIGAGGALEALEVAVGQPTEIYVALPDQPWRIGVGAIFTFYEFGVPPGERMTDEQWQAKVESGDTPAQPEWTQSFIVP